MKELTLDPLVVEESLPGGSISGLSKEIFVGHVCFHNEGAHGIVSILLTVLKVATIHGCWSRYIGQRSVLEPVSHG